MTQDRWENKHSTLKNLDYASEKKKRGLLEFFFTLWRVQISRVIYGKLHGWFVNGWVMHPDSYIGVRLRFYPLLSQSMQKSFSLLVQKVFPHFIHVVLRSNPLSPGLTGVKAVCALGKLIAFLWHMGSHAMQPFTHLCGLATMAFPSLKANTPFGQ